MIECVFFEFGSTLGDVDPETLRPTPYADTQELVASLRGLRMCLGIISNDPAGMSSADLARMLVDAGLAPFFDAELIVASAPDYGSKPAASIHAHAAELAGVRRERCLFVGENLADVIGAETAGMRARLKPRPS